MSLPTAASVVSSGLAAYPSIYFDRVAVDTISSNLQMYGALDLKTMPDKSGVVMQIFDHSKMSANTTPQTEGTPGSGQTITQNIRSISLDQFVDYISISDKVEKTMLIDQASAASSLLGYRGALSVDTIIGETLDLAANTDSATRIDLNTGVYLTASKVRQASFSLQSVDIKPKANGLYYGVAHSLTIFDLINDSTVGGHQDVWKFTDAKRAQGDIAANAGQKPAATIGGVELYASNAVKSYANWQSGTHTAYATWIVGKDAIFGSSLGKTALGQKNFSVEMKRFDGGNSIDVAGLIRAAVVYNFFFGCAKRPGSTNGFRRIRCESSLA